MANTIDYDTRLKAGSYVTFTSRYKTSSVVFYGDDRKTTFTTYKRTTIPASETDTFLTVTTPIEFRPDIVSYKAYGTPDYWWKILEFNGISDIYDFRAGLNIRIPTNLV